MKSVADIGIPPVKKLRGIWHTFAVPTVMGLLSTVGLVAALLGDDIWDWLSWATLAVPVLVVAYFMIWPARMR